MKHQKIVFIQALKIYIAIVLYFFIMKIFGLEDIVQLRLFNFVFMFWGVNGAIKKNLFINLDNTYLTNLSIGFATATLAVLFTTISLIVYLKFINPPFIEIVENSTIWGSNLRPPHVVFAILIEGLASAVITSFVVMQYWKKYKVPTE